MRIVKLSSLKCNPWRGMKEFKKLPENLQNSLITKEYIRQYCNKKYPMIATDAPKTSIGTYLKFRIILKNIFHSFNY